MADEIDAIRERHEAILDIPSDAAYAHNYEVCYPGRLLTDLATLLAAHDRLTAEVERLRSKMQRMQGELDEADGFLSEI